MAAAVAMAVKRGDKVQVSGPSTDDDGQVISILALSSLVRETLSAEADALAAERQALLDEMGSLEATARRRGVIRSRYRCGPRGDSRGRGSDARRGQAAVVDPGSVRPRAPRSRRPPRPDRGRRLRTERAR